jgi:Tfp pilus assembly PilM family ATPase
VIYERSISESGLGRAFEALRTRLGLDESAIELLLSGGLDRRATQDAKPGPLHTEARSCITEYLDALIPEVQRSLTYATHKYQGWSMARLAVTGDGASLTGLLERLNAVNCPVTHADAAAAFQVATHHRGDTGAAMFAAAGASLHATAAVRRRAA